MDAPDMMEVALASALEAATKACRWDVVALLAKQLEARTLGLRGRFPIKKE
jgi:hypothetical protein